MGLSKWRIGVLLGEFGEKYMGSSGLAGCCAMSMLFVQKAYPMFGSLFWGGNDK